ncbi:MAG: gliding motility lipoprotein GldH [Cyclobacteriaceae bacterium]
MRLLILLFAATIISCDSSRVYEDYENMEDAFWHMDSVKRFTFEIDDIEKSYNVMATFRNVSSYPFYNIYFQYSLTDSLDSVVVQQLKEADLFNPKTGEPLGSGLGDMFDHTIPVLENYTFPNEGTYNIKFQQFMRLDSLPFILSVGARVEVVEGK